MAVLVVSPGYVRTQVPRHTKPHPPTSKLSRNALTAGGAAHGALDATTEGGYSAEWVAARVVEAVRADRQELVLAPLHHRLAILLRALLPSLFFHLMARWAAKPT